MTKEEFLDFMINKSGWTQDSETSFSSYDKIVHGYYKITNYFDFEISLKADIIVFSIQDENHREFKTCKPLASIGKINVDNFDDNFEIEPTSKLYFKIENEALLTEALSLLQDSSSNHAIINLLNPSSWYLLTEEEFIKIITDQPSLSSQKELIEEHQIDKQIIVRGPINDDYKFDNFRDYLYTFSFYKTSEGILATNDQFNIRLDSMREIYNVSYLMNDFYKEFTNPKVKENKALYSDKDLAKFCVEQFKSDFNFGGIEDNFLCNCVGNAGEMIASYDTGNMCSSCWYLYKINDEYYCICDYYSVGGPFTEEDLKSEDFDDFRDDGGNWR